MVLFFYGPNSYALRQEIRRLTEAYIKKTGSNLELERVDGSRTTSKELSGLLNTAPFLASSRLVIVEGLGGNKAAAPAIGDLIKELPSSTVAVFADPEVDKRSSYYKTLLSAAQAVEFTPLATGKLESWVRQEVTRQGARITPAAVRRLIELGGDDQWRLSGEIGKLANYTTEITPPVIDDLVEAGFSETIFNLVDAMTAGRSGMALKLFRGLVLQRTSEIYILTMIQWQLRNLLLAKASGNLAPSQLAKEAGLSPFVASKAVAKRPEFTLETLKRAFRAAVECESRIKSGQAPAETAVERLIYQIAAQPAT